MQRPAKTYGHLFALLIAVAVSVLPAAGQRHEPHPTLSPLAPNTALDLGPYRCDQPADAPDHCGLITDYSRFVYDAVHHQFLMFGGGHAATHRTDVDVLDMRSLKWRSAYPSTPCSQMRTANIDRHTGSWRSTGHPIARHTYDMLVMTGPPQKMLMLTSSSGIGYCVERPPAGINDPYFMEGRIAMYDPASKTWSYSTASAGGWSYAAAADWDPVSRRAIVLDQYGLWTYDPVTQTKTRHDRALGEILYAKNLVYFPPTDRMYHITNGDAVFEVTLDRSDFGRSTVKRVTGITGDVPQLVETGFAYDPLNRMIGGAVRDGAFYAYDPLQKTWIKRVMKTIPPGASIGSVAFHALDYDEVNNMFVFLTDNASGRHTWAFRFSPR